MENKLNILNVAQYSDEWWLARKGRFTASDAHTISVAGAGLKTLTWEKATEMIMTDEQYLSVLSRKKGSTQSMLFGSAQELFSREWLENKINCTIEEGGIALFDDNTSFSADGFINNTHGVEIKNHEPKIALKMFTKIEEGLSNNLSQVEIYDREHYSQIQFSLLKSKLENWIFSLGSDCWGDAQKYWYILPDQKRMDAIQNGLEIGQNLIYEYIDKILNSNKLYIKRMEIKYD